MIGVDIFVCTVVGLVFIFTFINGFHDGCNVVATIIASRSMSPEMALLWASISEFLGAVFLGTAVATTIGKGIIAPQAFTPHSPVPILLIFSGIICAIVWDLITWLLGLPSSSSHALVGGLAGGGIGAFGLEVINWNVLFYKVILIMFLTPIIGMLAGYILTRLSFTLLADCHPRINNWIKRIQFFSMCFLGASHGTNDAQKSMGLIALILTGYGLLNHFFIPWWVVIGCALAISLGVSSGGWRLIRTVGFRIFKLEPIHSLNAQLAAGSVIYISGLFGSPVSTSQIMSSSVMGVGAAHKFKEVRWIVAKDILLAWLITIPVVSIGSTLLYWGLATLFHVKQSSFPCALNIVKVFLEGLHVF